MPTPTDDRGDRFTVIAFMKAAPGKEAEVKSAGPLDAYLPTQHLVRVAGMIGNLFDESGLTITRPQRSV